MSPTPLPYFYFLSLPPAIFYFLSDNILFSSQTPPPPATFFYPLISTYQSETHSFCEQFVFLTMSDHYVFYPAVMVRTFTP